MHFTQTMGEFFALDGSIESSKLVISEALKRGPDLGNFLRGGPFASCAQVYRNLSSKFDFDAAYFLSAKSPNFWEKANEGYPRSSSGNSSNIFQYPVGYCFKFQKSGECHIRDCMFKHYCSTCKSSNHGADKCVRTSRKNKEEAQPKNHREGERQKSRNRDSSNWCLKGGTSSNTRYFFFVVSWNAIFKLYLSFKRLIGPRGSPLKDHSPRTRLSHVWTRNIKPFLFWML